MASSNKAREKSRQQQEIDRIFAMMEEAIRLNEYGADDLFYMIADLTPHNPELAIAIGKHTADFIAECNVQDDPEQTWTDIVVEAYRRALFDEVQSPQYGTGYFIGNPKAMTRWVTDYIKNHTLGDDATTSDSAVTH